MERGAGHKAGNQSLGSRNLFPKLAPMGRSFCSKGPCSHWIHRVIARSVLWLDIVVVAVVVFRGLHYRYPILYNQRVCICDVALFVHRYLPSHPVTCRSIV